MARVDIAIADAEQWQGIDADILHIMLEGSYRSFVDMIGYELDKDIVVTNDLNSKTPMIFFPLDTREERERYCITLKVEDTRNWGEIVYQLSHEICHAYCNFYKGKATKHKWFEEAICEAGAFSNLNNIYQIWNDLPFAGHPALETFRQEIPVYLDKLLDGVPRGITTGDILDFINVNLPVFEIKSITKIWDRDSHIKLRAISCYLCEQLFYSDSRYWQSVLHFNEWDAANDKNFVSFINSWAKHGGDDVRPVAASLGILLI